MSIPASSPVSRPAGGRAFAHVDTWVFDLDNTLYPAEIRLFAQVDQRMGDFIAGYLGVPFEHARHLQKVYYRQFGTTLSGMMQVHKMDPKAFLAYVHDLDLASLPPSPELRAAIERLPGRKLIFTNGSLTHAERIAAKIGILDLFSGICDIEACGFQPKPGAAAFATFVSRHGVEPARAAMFEDMPHNLEVPHALGMTTVLVRSSLDNPTAGRPQSWAASPPGHIHHTTHDLPAFLTDIV